MQWKLAALALAFFLAAGLGASLDADYGDPSSDEAYPDEGFEEDVPRDFDSPRELTRNARSFYEDFASWCRNAPLGGRWKCDDPLSRALWKAGNFIRFGFRVYDCNSFCKVAWKKNSGSCQPGSSDVSTWCPRGRHCACN